MGTNYKGTQNELEECVNDAKDVTYLLKWEGFLTDTYLEEQVSGDKFVIELTKLVDLAVSGDITGAGFSHSGHGTQGVDTEEVDMYREGLYFNDRVVWDDEVAKILSRIPEGFPFFIFLDTCFSGGMMSVKGNPGKPRFVQTEKIPKKFKKKLGFRKAITANAIYIAACSEGEYSYDAVSLGNGAATYYLKTSYSKENTFQEWFNKIKQHLPSSKYPQTPQLICKEEFKDMKAFSSFKPVVSDVPDISPTPNPNPTPVPTAKKNWWKKFVDWLKKIFKAVRITIYKDSGGKFSRFEMYKSIDGQYYFVFKAKNNETVCSSETYTAKQMCRKGIDILKRDIEDAKVMDYTGGV